MTVEEFQHAAQTELKKRYGIDLVDTHLCERDFVEGCIADGESVEGVVAWIGEKYSLIQIESIGDLPK